MRSIENIHEITKAMQMIAAFRFKRAESRFVRAKPYLTEMEAIVSNLSRSLGEETSPPPLFEKRKIRHKTLVVMTGDKGLCGAYNTNILKAAAVWFKEQGAFEPAVVPVGKVGFEFFRKRNYPMALSYPERSMVDRSFSRKITTDLKELFLSGKSDEIAFLYNSYRAGGTGRNLFVPFLGLSALLEKTQPAKTTPEYLYEPDFESVFVTLVSSFLDGKTYLCLLESLTSEYAARRVAMKQATENGEEVLDNLKLLRNKTRQATITRELSEIVSGASGLV